MGGASDAPAGLTRNIVHVLDRLALVEGHWPNPGLAAIDELRAFGIARDVAALGETVQWIRQRRRLPVPVVGAARAEDEAGPDGRPRFEVLLVDYCAQCPKEQDSSVA